MTVHKWDIKPYKPDDLRYVQQVERRIEHPVTREKEEAELLYASTTPDHKNGSSAAPLTGHERALRDAKARVAGRKWNEEVAASSSQHETLNALYPTTPVRNKAKGQKTYRTVSKQFNGD